MKVYLLSLGAGLLVGVIYALLQVRSPAPPAIALLGLLGMLAGEQLVPLAKRTLAGEPVTLAWFQSECAPKMTGVAAPHASTTRADKEN
ncbi:MAG: XapX domain-containing protein [Burkholderiaceae bacterium]|nr:XapX domain-containing protein [Roseateles sp.]MBV8470234.1 XapX domain-containing protein [Burkholderiaceae bacterium]